MIRAIVVKIQRFFAIEKHDVPDHIKNCRLSTFNKRMNKTFLSNMTEDFSQKALVWRLWDWMIRQRPKVFRHLGRRQKSLDAWVTGWLSHRMTEPLDDWVTGWLSHWMTESLSDWLLTLTNTHWHLLTLIDAYWHQLTSTDWHLLTSTDTYWH